MVLLSPFLRELRRAKASARITLVCLPGSVILYRDSAYVDEVVPFAATLPRLLRPALLPRRARIFAERHLRGRFDLAIVPRWDTDHYLASAVSLLSRASRRVGYSERVNPRKQILNAGFDTLFTDVVQSVGVAHEVERHTTLLRALGCEPVSDALTISLTASDRDRAAAELSGVSKERTLVAFGVGAADLKRRWPIARFAELGQRLQRDHGAHVIVVGGPGDVAAQGDLMGQLGANATAWPASSPFVRRPRCSSEARCSWAMTRRHYIWQWPLACRASRFPVIRQRAIRFTTTPPSDSGPGALAPRCSGRPRHSRLASTVVAPRLRTAFLKSHPTWWSAHQPTFSNRSSSRVHWNQPRLTWHHFPVSR